MQTTNDEILFLFLNLNFIGSMPQYRYTYDEGKYLHASFIICEFARTSRIL